MTAVFNTALTAAQWNTHVRDNSLLTMPALATAGDGRWFISRNDSTKLQQQQISTATVTTSQTTTSTSYADLATSGPAVTVTTRTKALVFWSVDMQHSATDEPTFASVAVTGATTNAASDERALRIDGMPTGNASKFGMAHLFDTLTAGSNTFTLRYRVTTGTGTFGRRDLTVVAM